jgi:lysophospholipase L1-like esterase
MMTLTFSTKGMNKFKTEPRKIFSYKRFCLTICGVLLFTQFAAPRVQAQPTVLYTALGDSIGFGLFARPLSDGYVPTYRRFIEEDTNLNVELINLSFPTLTSGGLRSAIDGIREVRLLIAASRIVTVNIGSNDLLSARDDYKDGTCGGADNQNCLREAVNRFRSNFNAILDTVLSLRSVNDTIIRTMNIYNPFVDVDMEQDSWPNDEGNDFQVINMYLDDFNSIIADAANGRNIPFAQVHLAFNGPNGDVDPGDLGLIAFDGVHPNNQGHRLIADLLRGLGFSPFECSAFRRKPFLRGLNRTT